jgi:hypothetical protein
VRALCRAEGEAHHAHRRHDGGLAREVAGLGVVRRAVRVEERGVPARGPRGRSAPACAAPTEILRINENVMRKNDGAARCRLGAPGAVIALQQHAAEVHTCRSGGGGGGRRGLGAGCEV